MAPPPTKKLKPSRDDALGSSQHIPPTLELGSVQQVEVVSPTRLVSWDGKNTMAVHTFRNAVWEKKQFLLSDLEPPVEAASDGGDSDDFEDFAPNILLAFLSESQLVVWAEDSFPALWTDKDDTWSSVKLKKKSVIIKSLLGLGDKHIVALSTTLTIWTEEQGRWCPKLYKPAEKIKFLNVERVQSNSFLLYTCKENHCKYLLWEYLDGQWKETDLLMGVENRYPTLSGFIPLQNDRLRVVLSQIEVPSMDLLNIDNESSSTKVLIGIFGADGFLSDSWREVELGDPRFKIVSENQLVSWSERPDLGCNKVKVWINGSSGDWTASEVLISADEKFSVKGVIALQDRSIVLHVRDILLSGDARESSESIVILDASANGKWRSWEHSEKGIIRIVKEVYPGILLIELEPGIVKYIDINAHCGKKYIVSDL